MDCTCLSHCTWLSFFRAASLALFGSDRSRSSVRVNCHIGLCSIFFTSRGMNEIQVCRDLYGSALETGQGTGVCLLFSGLRMLHRGSYGLSRRTECARLRTVCLPFTQLWRHCWQPYHTKTSPEISLLLGTNASEAFHGRQERSLEYDSNIGLI